ncbi:uncharacterized protein BDCG_00075 [Blastomyces dermatitidis ER-3]|uniref:Uncharacterized protein n=1 Tax=Ajellomyces dermatitidis (strain ER-3 / ATCC MYA-2586) TaxID=559297 RepID=A0ABP2EPY7_AJEDR|nr:uncharacterized protein BDCG_00075 [Blastomyces dermatitidis ER-3]EEQ83270.2 hypothetical protein BDCG_00075 [Blastomyces dermatitidis ER-3]
MNTFSSQYKQHSSLLPEPEDMQNLSEGLLEAVRKAAETTKSELKLCMCTRILNKIEALCMQWQAETEVKQQLTFTADQVFTMKSFVNAITIINKNRENQILGLQQKIKCLYRQITTLNLKISSQSFTISSEAYTSSETAVQNENLSMKYIKLRDLLKLSSFNSN